MTESVTETPETTPRTVTGTPPLAVSVRDLYVTYRVYEDIADGERPARGRRFRSRASTTVRALNGVTLDVHMGEAVGIVGSNGSGKSTLLRAVAGVQDKERGTVLVRGFASLLGVGATLEPSLSGYRNVMLGGLAMGLSREEVQDRLVEVQQFSGLGQAMARPMRTYSSGMKARLAFSIATLRTPDILLVDEALAVGDRGFKRRSLRRINEIRENAGAVLMVTHQLGEIRRTCTRAVWLHQGEVRLDGDVEDVLAQYEAFDAQE